MLGQAEKKSRPSKLHRTLRKNMTDAEMALWRHLRGRQVLGVKFRRQHPFGEYILDFVCIEKRLVIEVDGGNHAENVVQDETRTRFLEDAGFRVLRFWNHEVLKEAESVTERIMLMVQELSPHPHPDPPLGRRGG